MGDSKKVVESLESLWFFNNVLTLPSFEHKGHGFALYEDTVEEEEEPSKPKIQDAEILVLRYPKCGEIAAELEQQPITVTEVEFAKPTEKSRRRRRRSKRKVLGEIDLGLHCRLAYESSFSEGNIARSNSETPQHTQMPPLNDGLAMEQHLKSWAYAVACTVK